MSVYDTMWLACHACALTKLYIPIEASSSGYGLDDLTNVNIYLSEAVSVKSLDIGVQKLKTYVRPAGLLIS